MSISIIGRPQQIMWITQRYSSTFVNDFFKQQFNRICNILEQYNLINVPIDNEEKKEKAFQSCIPIFEHIRKASLHDDIYNYIEQILSTLDIDIHVKDGFENIFKSIIEEIQKLKLCVDTSATRIEGQEKTIKEQGITIKEQGKTIEEHGKTIKEQGKTIKEHGKTIEEHGKTIEEHGKIIKEQGKAINTLQTGLRNLESQWLLRNIQIDAYEVVTLFRFYYVNKVIREKAPYLKEWIRFIKEWSKVETEVIRLLKLDKKEVFTDHVQNHSMVAKLLNPIEEELKLRTNATIKLLDLRKIVSDRHEIAHHDLRTIADQQALIDKCEQTTYPDDYPYKITLKQMVDCLKRLDSGDQTLLRPFY
ncbi:unnamed protein product [Rotaria sp. Silwood1]|nr:unnamed protein product [Rotaria sp. Silwood1]CAF4947044.1 unnamed protein product [Rotaria sp. Silwood1]